jgi:CubicO group peptidase (beta-lactamase class C family)
MRKVAVCLPLSLSLLIVVLAASSGDAQPAPSDAAKVDALFARWDKSDSPGAAVAVIKDGKIVHARGYGMANLESGLAITAGTVFLIASLSKHFTVFCILLLVQGGRLNLDDDVRKHVPEVPDFGKKITVRHLIHHTSGLREYLPLLSYAGWRSGDSVTERDVLDLVSHQKELNFEPGSEHLYCNTGYELLGVIVKRVSGQSLREYAQEHVFEPLGMRHSEFRDDYKALVKGLAQSYTGRPGGGFQYGLVHHGLAGASNVHTTVEDLALWDRNFYDARVGGKKLLEQMHEKYTLTGGKEINYAGGLNIGKYRGLATVDHTGAHGGFRSILLRFPEQKFSVVVLANSADVITPVLARKVADIYLEGHFKEEKKDKGQPVAVHPAVCDCYVGEYLLEAGFVVNITRTGDKLVVQTAGEPQELVAVSDNEFYDATRDTTFTFRAAKGEMKLAVRMVSGQEFVGKRLQQIKLSDEERKQFLGRFYSEELEVLYNVVERDGKLWVRHRKGEMALRPTAADEFMGDFGEYGGVVTVRFVRDADKHVSGFGLSSGRVKNLRFARAEIKAAP